MDNHKCHGVKLSFENKAIDLIVDKAMEYKLGARGLRSICEVIMLDAMFTFPTKKEKRGGFDIKALVQFQLLRLRIHLILS